MEFVPAAPCWEKSSKSARQCQHHLIKRVKRIIFETVFSSRGDPGPCLRFPGDGDLLDIFPFRISGDCRCCERMTMTPKMIAFLLVILMMRPPFLTPFFPHPRPPEKNYFSDPPGETLRAATRGIWDPVSNPYV